MSKIATKDKHEKEQEEAERLVRKSPKKKPPRRDKERGRMKTYDPDMGRDTDDDKDLSMNFKDVGGSVIARRVALRFVNAFEFDPNDDASDPESSSEEGDEEVVADETDPTLGEGDDEEVSEEPEPEKRDPPDIDDIQEEAEKLYHKPAAALQDMLATEGYSEAEKQALRHALALKTAPLPPLWDRKKVFEDGIINLKARRYFREHMENWDAKDFADNLTHFKERLLNESLTTGRQDNERYYEVMIEIVEEEWEDFQEKGPRPLQDLKGLMSGLENPHDEFSEDDEKVLESQCGEWRERLRRTSIDTVKRILRETTSLLSFAESEGTVEYAWLTKIKSILEGALEMKKNASEGYSIVASIRSGFQRAAQYRGLPGPLADDEEYYKPPSPKWRKPDPLDLTIEDFGALLKEAKAFLKKPFLANDIAKFNPDMARRLALDYAIFSLDDGKYDKTVDAPTYDALLDILARVTEA